MPALERSGHSFDDLVQLPRFDAASAVALGDDLVHAASAEAELPRPIRRALDALSDDLGALRGAAAARLASAAVEDHAAVASADRTLDDCWSALFDWLTGFSKLPEGLAQGAEARAILHEVYPDGLSFILLPYELEWNQSDLRLARIAGETLGDRIRALGGQVFLDALTEAHARYGKLLGLPRAPGAADPSARSVAEALESFGAALRIYALKVTAFVEVDEPDTAALSQRLLAPLLHWSA